MAKYPNPVEPDNTPNTRTVKTGLVQIPEPTLNVAEQGTCQIPEPVSVQIPEPLQYGLEIDSDILSNHTRLWRLETYEDRHGKVRARRVLRFVKRPEPRIELGQVSAEVAEELKARPGHGRHKASRDEADELRRVAQHVAVAFRRDKRLWRRREAIGRYPRFDYPANQRHVLPDTQDDAQWPDMPNVLM